MKISFAAGMHQLLFAVLLVTGSLSTVACKKDSVTTNQDYSKIDDDIIKKYLDDNKITNAQRQPSGLYYVPITTNPNGVRAAAGNTVSVQYTGLFLNGTVFDASSRNGNVPYKFVLGSGNAIQGWHEGIALMHKGDKSQLLIPSALAYGPSGSGSIPPNTVLRFVVELEEVK